MSARMAVARQPHSLVRGQGRKALHAAVPVQGVGLLLPGSLWQTACGETLAAAEVLDGAAAEQALQAAVAGVSGSTVCRRCDRVGHSLEQP